MNDFVEMDAYVFIDSRIFHDRIVPKALSAAKRYLIKKKGKHVSKKIKDAVKDFLNNEETIKKINDITDSYIGEMQKGRENKKEINKYFFSLLKYFIISEIKINH